MNSAAVYLGMIGAVNLVSLLETAIVQFKDNADNKYAQNMIQVCANGINTIIIAVLIRNLNQLHTVKQCKSQSSIIQNVDEVVSNEQQQQMQTQVLKPKQIKEVKFNTERKFNIGTDIFQLWVALITILFILAEDLRSSHDIFSLYLLKRVLNRLPFTQNSEIFDQVTHATFTINSGLFIIISSQTPRVIIPVKEILSIIFCVLLIFVQSFIKQLSDLQKENQTTDKQNGEQSQVIAQAIDPQDQLTSSIQMKSITDQQRQSDLLNIVANPSLLKSKEIDRLVNLSDFLKFFPFGQIIIDRNLNIIFANSLSLKYLQIKREQLIISNFKSIRVSNFIYETLEEDQGFPLNEDQNLKQVSTLPMKLGTQDRNQSIQIPTHSVQNHDQIQAKTNIVNPSKFSTMRKQDSNSDEAEIQKSQKISEDQQMDKPSLSSRLLELKSTLDPEINEVKKPDQRQKTMFEILNEYLFQMQNYYKRLDQKGPFNENAEKNNAESQKSKPKNLVRISGIKDSKQFSISISPIQVEEIQGQYYMIIIEDSTTIIRVQELEEIIKYQGKCLNSVSHELRTPLNGSISILDLSLRNQQISEKIKKNSIVPALASCQLLLSMINCIIDNNQIECTSFSYQFRIFTFQQLTDELQQIFHFSAKQKKLDFDIDIPESLIEKPVNADYERIKQVLINLLSNSFKFTSRGGIKIEIEKVPDHQLSQNHEVYKCSVYDTGCGMSADLLQSLINLFQIANLDQTQEDDTLMQTKGIGFGLRISSRLILGLSEKGQFEIQSEIERGSQFTFYIKCHELQKKAKSLQKQQMAFDKEVFFWNKTRTVRFEYQHQNTQNIHLTNAQFQYEKRIFQEEIQRRKCGDQVNQEIHQEDIEINSQHMIEPPKSFIVNRELEGLCSNRSSRGEQEFLLPGEAKNFNFPESRSKHVDVGTPELKFELLEQNKNEQKHKILVIDDNQFNVLGLQLLLEEQGFQSDSAFSGYEAIQMIKQIQSDPYTMIISDVDMPELDGFQTVGHILDLYQMQLWQRPFISFCTAFNDEYTIKSAESLGMDFFLQKPVQSEQILRLLQKTELKKQMR